MNKLFLVGNLGQAPELRHTNGGTAVLNMRIATNRRVKKGEEWVDEATWHSIVVFGKRAEGLAKCNLSAGDKIVVEGRLEYRSYEKDGESRTFAQVLADEVILCGGKGSGKPRSAATEPGPDDGFNDDDIPF